MKPFTMKSFTDFLETVDNHVWGIPLMVFILGTGIFLTIRLRGIQFRGFGQAFKNLFSKDEKTDKKGEVSGFAALCTALSATIGTGNIVGVATAIKAGGPGAILWMWIAAFFGMATKYAEGCLAVKYRTVDDKGQISGGPMYYIENGLGKAYRPLAIAFAFFGVLVAYFGIGTFAQVNSIVQITQLNAGIPVTYTAVVLTILVAAITLGGLQSIAKTASKVVPAMAVIYMASTIGFLVIFADKVPGAVAEVFYDAFHPTAAVGGFLGASVLFAMRNGVARGVFSNESGLGSAPIVAAAAKTKWPAEQGLVSMTGTFIDTIIICTMTGLVVVISGLWKTDLNGAALTNAAFLQAYPSFGGYMLMVGLVLFAFTTILGWNYYGERCMEYLVGTKGIMPYRIGFIILVGCGAFLKLESIWILADIVNGLMAIPNLIALLGLSGVVVAETRKYMEHVKAEKKGV